MRQIFTDISKIVTSKRQAAAAAYFDFRADFADDPIRALKKHGQAGLEGYLVLQYIGRLYGLVTGPSYPSNIHAVRAVVGEIQETCQHKIDRAEISQINQGPLYRALMEAEIRATDQVLETMKLISRYLNEID